MGEVLTNPRLTADIIADGVHVDPVVVRLFLNAKGVDGAVLITDATSATGMPDGKYLLGTLEVEVKDGMVQRDGKLAGSVLTMDRAVRNAMKFAGWDLQRRCRSRRRIRPRSPGSTAREFSSPARMQTSWYSARAGEVQATVVLGNLIQ